MHHEKRLVKVLKNSVVTYLRTDVKKFLNYYYKDLFDGTLGEFHTNPPVYLDLKEGAIPKHHKPFPVAKIHEDTSRRNWKDYVK